MICEKCTERDKRSKVYPHTLNRYEHPRTLVFYDENGVFHDHHPTRSYTCSQGHSWIEEIGDKCWCQTFDPAAKEAVEITDAQLNAVIAHTEVGSDHD